MALLPEYRMPISARTMDAFLPRSDEWQQIDLNAPYQRDSVWDDTKRQNLIRSILMGVPIGAVILSQLPMRADNINGAFWRVVDGKQRIETLRLFATDGFTVPGDWFDMPDMVLFSQLSTVNQRRWRNQTIAVCEVKLDSFHQWVDEGTPGARLASGGWILDTHRTDDEILAAEAELYLLINRGGVPHADDDLTTARALAKETN